MIKEIHNGRTYTHQNMLDINVYIGSIVSDNETHVDAFVHYYNKHLEGLFHGCDRIKINKSEFDKWIKVR